jgi:hypothetical protein
VKKKVEKLNDETVKMKEMVGGLETVGKETVGGLDRWE